MSALTDGWTPGIGDPTPMGWITVGAYFLAALAAALAARRSRSGGRFWSLTTVLLVLLCINKQLDLQSLLTVIGRNLAQSGHWYDQRHEYQKIFIATLLALSLIIVSIMAVRMRHATTSVRIASVGVTLLLAFIAIRAASFHHVDALLGSRLGGWRLNWIFELGGIALIGFPAAIALRAKPTAQRRRR